MTAPHVELLRARGARAATEAHDVGLEIDNLDDLFHTPLTDPMNGRFETRSGFDRLVDDVEPILRPLVITLSVTGDAEAEASAERVERALAGVAQGRIAQLRAERIRIRRLGLKELGFGLAFLALCLIAGSSIAAFDIGPVWFRHFATEGLVIVGWISLWHPVDMLFFDRLPIAREQRVLARIACARVRVVPARQ